MPFKSQAQRRKFAQLLVEGKISNETFEEWNRETGGTKLPNVSAQERRSLEGARRPRPGGDPRRKSDRQPNEASRRSRIARAGWRGRVPLGPRSG